MDNVDLTHAMQAMIAEMTAMRAELTVLKARANKVTSPQQPVKSVASITRRNTLKRLGLALLGGAAAATTLGAASSVQARVIANPQINGLATRAGMVVLVPGAAIPTGTAPANVKYGLIASSETTALDMNSLPPQGNVGVYANGTTGVYANGTNYGVRATANTGVYGTGTTYGIQGDGNTYGVYGTSSSNTGVYGNAGITGVFGNGGTIGVHGRGSIGTAGLGILASLTGTLPISTKIGLFGNANVANLNLSTYDPNTQIAVYGKANIAANNYAGLFEGNVSVFGSFSATVKNFKIDHPLDPANKYLYHTSVESPDMMNIYNGIVRMDQEGYAEVEMPDWFEALNSDFRYQLTCLERYAPVYISRKMKEGKFKIGGGLPGQEVSWQVTGIRQDAWAKANRIPVEEDKNESQKGKYLHPEVIG
jgi:hypothetical protein